MHQKQEDVGLSVGARAALDLRLQDARRDLQEALERKNSATHQADVYRALADEAAGARRVSCNSTAIKYRLQAMGMEPEVRDLRGRVAMLEGMLAQPAGHAAPVALTAEQVAAMDETAGVL